MSENLRAYPCLDSNGYGLSMRDPGMTLRDYFAGQALIGLLHPGYEVDSIDAPTHAYRLADIMIAERAKETSGE